MPSLNDILKDTLLVIANGGTLDGFLSGDPTSITPPKPTPTKDAPITTGTGNQSIWWWEKAPATADRTDPGCLGKVTRVNCWERVMADSHNDDKLGWMTVCHSITWSPVKVEVKRGNSPFKLTLPLTEKYVVKTVFLGSGHNPGTGWWPLEADVDSSFFQVFVYDITGKTSKDAPDTVPSDVLAHDDFMPDPAKPPLPAPTLSPGDKIEIKTAHNHFVVVVMSLACTKERADFEPGALVGVARMVPHFMIMTNMPLDGIEASIRIERPDESGYYGSSTDDPRPPMQHHDMDPPLGAIAATDTNLFRAVDLLGVVNIPYWDLIFDYVIDVPHGDVIQFNDSMKVVKDEPDKRTDKGALGMLDYALVSKAVRGAAEASGALTAFLAGANLLNPLGTPLTIAGMIVPVAGAAAPAAAGGAADAATIAFTRPGIRIVHRGPNSTLKSNVAEKVYGSAGLRKDDLLPRKNADVVKWPRQGQFDSIHVAPRMKADLLLARGGEMTRIPWVDTLTAVLMAPFCEHDCLHTHWRWGANWLDIRFTPLRKNGKQISGFGGDATGKFSGVGVPYTEIGAPMVPLNQVVSISFESEHVFNYTANMSKNIVPGVWQTVFHHGSAYALSIVDKDTVGALTDLVTGCSLDDVKPPEFSEFYWSLRFQDTVNGPLERIFVDDTGLKGLMRL